MKKMLLVFALMLSMGSVFAQTPNLVAGKDYDLVQVTSQQAVAQPKVGKPLVIEFFWYGCPHCYHMEPLVKKLIADRKGDIEFIRIHAGFPNWASGAKLSLTIKEMGLEDKLHDAIFDTIHAKHINIMDDAQKRDAFLKTQGVDVTKFNEVYNSFAIATKLNQLKATSIAYKIQSTPSFVIDNKYEVYPGLPNLQNYGDTIKMINLLIDKEKAGK